MTTPQQTKLATELTQYEKDQAKFARHRALIMQILNAHPNGLTTQAIIAKELEYYGYSFLTDNRLRELRSKGWIESVGESPMRWRVI